MINTIDNGAIIEICTMLGHYWIESIRFRSSKMLDVLDLLLRQLSVFVDLDAVDAGNDLEVEIIQGDV